MKIVAFELEDWERPAFDALARSHEVHLVPVHLDAHNVEAYRDADVISTFVYSDVAVEVLEQFHHLQLIATRSTGFDHIDTGWCDRRGVRVCNVPTYGTNTVAEHAFALLLAIAHRLVEAVDRTRRGEFTPRGLQGFDLRGKTLGVIGTGAIGRCTIEIAAGFGMPVLAYDIAPDPEIEGRLGFRYVDFDELLARSDVISLHVPLNPRTRHLISTRELAKMKDGVVLINTARGDVIDVAALVQALHQGKVAAAGLDVLPEEPAVREEAELLRRAFQEHHGLETLLADHVLLRMRNVIITPHSAFNTREAVQRILETTVQNIAAFARGEPENVVAGQPPTRGAPGPPYAAPGSAP